MSETIEDFAIAKLRELTGYENINRDTALEEVSLDSLDLMQWLSDIEYETGQDIDLQGLDYEGMNGLKVKEVLELFAHEV